MKQMLFLYQKASEVSGRHRLIVVTYGLILSIPIELLLIALQEMAARAGIDNALNLWSDSCIIAVFHQKTLAVSGRLDLCLLTAHS